MISQTAEYALRAVACLAAASNTSMTRSEIAASTLVPLAYLTRVMQQLAASEIVVIKRGPGGGYLLVEPWDQLSVLDVIESVESIARIDHCPLGIPGHETLCPLHAKLDEAAALVQDAFQESLIVDLIPKKPRTSTAPSKCVFPHGQ